MVRDSRSVDLPKEITSVDDFKKLAGKASLCKVVKRGDKVKLKLRTNKWLYIYKTNEQEAEELLKGLKIEAVDF